MKSILAALLVFLLPLGNDFAASNRRRPKPAARTHRTATRILHFAGEYRQMEGQSAIALQFQDTELSEYKGDYLPFPSTDGALLLLGQSIPGTKEIILVDHYLILKGEWNKSWKTLVTQLMARLNEGLLPEGTKGSVSTLTDCTLSAGSCKEIKLMETQPTGSRQSVKGGQ